MKKTSLARLALFYILFSSVQAQPSFNRIGIGYDLFKGLIYEHVFTVETNLGQKNRLELSGGWLYGEMRGGLRGLSPAQEDFPLFVSKGPSFRLAYMRDLTTDGPGGFFVGARALYRFSSYDDEEFLDYDAGDYRYFTRSEETQTLGVDFLLSLRGELFDAMAAPFAYGYFGIGIRTRFRSYTTTDSNTSNIPLGNFKEAQYYPVFVAGLRLGFAWRGIRKPQP